MKIFVEFLSLLFASLAAVFVLGRWFENFNMFAPDREHSISPEEFSLAPSESYVPSGKKGEKIHCWFFNAGGTKTILYVHGNAGNVSDRIPVIAGYIKNGLNVFIFDYRGYGKSEGRATKSNFLEDAFTAYDYLTGEIGIPAEQIIILGQSLGGIPATRLATQRKNRGLVLEGAFYSVREVARDISDRFPIWILASPDLDNGRELKKLTVPLMVLHGELDGTIPFRHSALVFGAAPETSGGKQKRLVTFESGGHTDLFAIDPEKYYGSINSFAE